MWKIEPARGVGPLSLGMTKTDCVAVLGDAFDEFRRTPDSRDVTLAFDSKHVHVTIDSEDRVKGISVFRPHKVVLGNVSLLGGKLTTVTGALEEAGIRIKHVDAGIWCPNEGILLVEVDGYVDGIEVGL